MNEPRPLKARNTFSGPGGWEMLAVRDWKWKVDGAENDGPTVATRDAAGLDTPYDDVRKIQPVPGEYDLDISSPSCKKFTLTGDGGGRRAMPAILRGIEVYDAGEDPDYEQLAAEIADPDAALVLQPLRIALEGESTFQAWEQVPPAIHVWNACAPVLERRGWKVVTAVLSAEQFGVPQTRERAVLLARRDGAEVRLPEPTHAKFGATGSPLPSPVSISDALGLPTDVKLVSNYGTGGDPKKRGFRWGHQPAATVTSKADRVKVHFPDGYVRNLTPQEAALLQSVPARWGRDGQPYPFQGNKGEVMEQIGNMVPAKMAQHLLSTFL